jgi:hypothetical protein
MHRWLKYESLLLYFVSIAIFFDDCIAQQYILYVPPRSPKGNERRRTCEVLLTFALLGIDDVFE